MPSESTASKLKLSDSCIQNAEDSKYLNIDFGLDLLFLNLKLKTRLDKKRNIQAQLLRKNLSSSGLSYSPKNLSRKNLDTLKHISKTTGLVEFYPNTKTPKWISFRNESSFLSDVLKGRGVLGKSARGLSFEALEFVFTMAQAIRVSLDDSKFLVTQKDWRQYSWGMLGNLLSYGIGQERIGKKLGLSRQSVNNAFNKNTPLEFHIENTFIPVSKELEGHTRYNPVERDKRLKLVNSGALKTLPNGQIVRQWVNRYSVSKEWLKNFKMGRKTFKYSNKALNRSLYSDSNQMDNLDSSMLAVNLKRYSENKARKRQEEIFKKHQDYKRFLKTQGIRGRKDGYCNYSETMKAIYSDSVGTGIRQLPNVLENEIKDIYRAGFELPYQVYGKEEEGFIEKVEIKMNLKTYSVDNESSLINEFLLNEASIRNGYKNGDENISRERFNLSMMTNRLYQEARSKQ